MNTVFYDKAEENKRVAMKCLNISAYNAGVSRAYYSVFQRVKDYLIKNNFDYGNFIAAYNQKQKKQEKAFSHSTIQRAVVEYMHSNGKKYQDYSALMYIDNLRKERNKADYDQKMFCKQELETILKEVEDIFTIFK